MHPSKNEDYQELRSAIFNFMQELRSAEGEEGGWPNVNSFGIWWALYLILQRH
jgi:hypothetical protein